MRIIEKSQIKKILIISLSNIGDVVLTFPVIDILKRDFPNSQVSVVIGPKARTLLEGNPHLHDVIIFDKHQAPLKILAWILKLRAERFDCVVDLRHTAIPLLLGARYRMSILSSKLKNVHMKDKHLHCLRRIYSYEKPTCESYALSISHSDQDFVDKFIHHELGANPSIVAIAPGAADEGKRWTEQGFALVADKLVEKFAVQIVFLGDKNDNIVVQRIMRHMRASAVNFCGRTSLMQSARVLEKSRMLISNDSAPMHLASYLRIPVAAIFGPTDPKKYGPWSKGSCFIQKNNHCSVCKDSDCGKIHDCMKSVTDEDVYALAKRILSL